MKKLVPLCLFLFVGLVTFASLAHAGAAGRIDVGIAVTKEIHDNAGHSFRITVIPPSNRVVDPAIFEGWNFSQDADRQHGLEMLAGSSDRKDAPAQKPIDVTGYQIFIEPVVMGAQSSCTGSYRIIKAAPYSLGPGGQFQASSTGPEEMDTIGYPTVGDVDTFVLVGTTICSSSLKGPGRLDTAGCFSSSCHNTSTLKGRFKNASNTTSAKFVGVISVFFVTL
jgi:hypothetical protein